ncbi:MAG: thiolase family protein [Candidatus Eisenbacteria bacterium]|uniref:acetyl-CoA C-acyltransferase n=1 Tax=Eiseniibacteriota bacterium TaxID=2212470 RepID=A0A538TS89_UNCEI|nr:MAG: thiolase family protein [Candidatus Eisenbacteria bacterium]
MESAWIVAARRTAFTRAAKGAFVTARPDDLLASLFRDLLGTLPPSGQDRLDEVVVGCAYPEAEQGRNAARLVALAAAVPERVPAMTLTRMCASSLEATAVACAKVRLGEARLVLVGGMESMTRIPIGGVKPSPNRALLERAPDAYMAMGLTAERVAARYGVGRADQDAWAVRSHARAATARAAGRHAAEILPVTVTKDGGSLEVAEDDAVRPDTTIERLAALKPAFEADGSVTAGNSCPTSDGASALLVASETTVRDLGLRPLGRFVSYAVAGVSPALMGIGPVEAVPIALARAGLSLDRIDRIELNEAFAAQVLAVMRELELPEGRTNVEGGSIALGHPLGATGARLVGTLLRQLQRDKLRYGLATLCVGGGMGAAMVLESAGGAE